MNTNKRFVTFFWGMSAKKSFLLLIASAFVFALPFVTKNVSGEVPLAKLCGVFGWCGLVPLFVTVFDTQKTLKRVLYSLFCFFFVFYFFVYSWFINLYPLDFAGLGNIESIGVIIIAETAIPFLHGIVMTLCVFLGYASAKQINNVFLKSILVSAGYVLGEYMQSVGTFAFPWARLFVGQTENVALLQSASLFGSYFITFIMVLVNSFLAFSLMNVQTNKKKCRNFALVATGIFLVNFTFGVLRINFADLSDCKKLSAVVLQGNIPSGEKWSGEVDEKEVYLQLSEYALAHPMAKEFDADIAVMPETAFPVTLITDDKYKSQHEKVLFEISQKLDAELFVGAFNDEGGKSYNSIFVFSPDGSVTKPYNKHNIVPFGEFLPYRGIIEKIAPSLAEMNMFTSEISRGESFEPIQTKAGKAACLVCFDSIFPETARKQIKGGGEFIVISTNDSWYKTSSAIYQHADHAIMRAIENNVPVIRSANTGVSKIIDNFGRVDSETKVNERTAIGESVYIPESMTLYTKTGDLVVPICGIMIFAFLLYGICAKKKASRN